MTILWKATVHFFDRCAVACHMIHYDSSVVAYEFVMFNFYLKYLSIAANDDILDVLSFCNFVVIFFF